MAKKAVSADALDLLNMQIREKQFRKLYVFHGEETYLLNRYLERLKKALIDNLTESFNYHKLTNENFSVDAFADVIEYPPMMAEHSLVVVDEINLFAQPKAELPALCRALENIPDYCTVIFTYGITPWKPDRQMKALHQAVDQQAFVVEFAKQERRVLVNWISRHFAAGGKRIPVELCEYLIDITDGTMTSLAGEIPKICGYSGAEVICKSDIDAVTEPVLDVVIFEITNLLGEGAYGAALQKLRQLLKKQSDKRLPEQCIGILGSISKHFRNLGAARTLLDSGKGVDDLARLRKLSSYPAQKTMAAARRFSPRFCAKASELVMQTDYKLKTSFDEPDRLLELLLLQLSQEARNG